MSFINTFDGGWINLDHVEQVSGPDQDEHGRSLVTLHLKGGRIKRAHELSFFEAVRAAEPIIAAQPEYIIVVTPRGDDEIARPFPQFPLIAWRYNGNYMLPVSTAMLSIEDNDEDYGILYPDGTVSDQYGEKFESLEAFEKYQRSRYAKMAASPHFSHC